MFSYLRKKYKLLAMLSNNLLGLNMLRFYFVQITRETLSYNKYVIYSKHILIYNDGQHKIFDHVEHLDNKLQNLTLKSHVECTLPCMLSIWSTFSRTDVLTYISFWFYKRAVLRFCTLFSAQLCLWFSTYICIFYL